MLVATFSLHIAQTNCLAGSLLRVGTRQEEAKQDEESQEADPGLSFRQ